MLPLTDAPLTYALLALTSLISAYAWFVDRNFFEQSIFQTNAILKGKQYHRLLTSSFLHGDPVHLLFNMYSLWIFGTAVEYLFGTANFAIIYFGSGLIASLFSLWIRRKEPNYMMVGASGAISGIVVAFCLYAPFQKLYILGILPMPAILFAAIFIAYSSFVMGRDNSRIAHEAHLGGALGGALLTLLLASDKITIF
ncbi:MAG: rhomboid family intramembrane serine protease [bacterium]